MEEEQSVHPHTAKHDVGKLKYGCEHYRRRCKIRAPCCDKIFPCRHCHKEAVNSLSDPKDHHELVRQNVKQVCCLFTLQYRAGGVFLGSTSTP
ncbi:hypothetical protein Patl1_01080 [Pistacia atlantica]|uniref:Uncharacterized protein n=1 Tax=Pistacia atlantica TaxID=434234 RepID=A0ACC1C5H9_9ROSI|nr:hypothetical protein Patl1_01080 [Pistacia atlantica]